MKKVFAVSLFALMLAVTLVGVADAQTIVGITPSSAAIGQTVSVVATGSGFTGACSVNVVGSGVTAGACNVVGPSEARFQITVADTADPGNRTLEITINGITRSFPFTVSTIATPERGIPSGITTAQGFVGAIQTLTDWLFVVLTVIAVVFIVLAGLQFITGGGDPTAISMARTKLIWAAVGIGVALLARGLPAALQNLIGV